MIMLYLTVSSIALILTVIYLVYHSNAHWTSKYAAVPLVIVIAFVLSMQFIKYSGTPITRFPDGEWVYVHHEITYDGEHIYLWVNHSVERRHRLYKIVYDRETAKKLGEAVAENGLDGEGVTVGEFNSSGELGVRNVEVTPINEPEKPESE